MSASGYGLVVKALDIGKVLLQLALFYVMWRRVLGMRRGRLAIASLLVVINIGIALLPYVSWPRYVLSALLVLGYCMVLDRKKVAKVVFALLAFYNFHCLSYLVANSIYAKAYDWMAGRIDVHHSGYEQNMYACAAAGMCILVFCYMALFVLMEVVFCRLIKEVSDMAWQDALLLSVLNAVGSIMANFVTELYAVKVGERVFQLFDVKPDLLWKMPMAAIFIYVGEGALIYFWQRYQVLLVEREKNFVEGQQIKAMRKRLQEAEHFYGSIRKVRHEMKNHMMNLKGLAGAGEYKEVEEYVRKMDETMQELEYKYTTGNAVTDVILNDKWRKSQKAGIRFEAEFWFGGGIPVFDLGIILNNLLDNAIEACEKLESGQGYIHLVLRQRRQFLLLEVENSFDGIVNMSKESALPVTTKPIAMSSIAAEHGIGLENVRDIAERHLGAVRIDVKGNIFRVSVMLQKGEFS